MESEKLPGRRLGRRKTDRARPVLQFGNYLKAAVPEHPVAGDHLSLVPPGDWNGATNFTFGTCGPVGLANHAIMTWKYLLGEDTGVTDDAIFGLYRASGNPDFDPETGAGDDGVDMTVMLSAAVKDGIEICRYGDNGLLDPKTAEVVKPLGFAAVQAFQADISEVDAATSITGGVLYGLSLETAQQAETDTGLWDYSPSPEWGGHAVFGGAYSASAGMSMARAKGITWTQPVGMTASFLSHQDDECYVVVWPVVLKHPAFQAGIDLPAFAADWELITGRKFPVPVPPPPAPPAPPLPAGGDPDLDAWAKVAIPWTAEHHVSHGNKLMDTASTKFLVAKGYLK